LPRFVAEADVQRRCLVALDSPSKWGFVLSIALYVAAAAAIIVTGAKRHPLVVIAVAVLLLLAAALANMTVRRVRTPPAQLPGYLRLGVPLGLMLIAVGLTVFFLTKGRTDGLGCSACAGRSSPQDISWLSSAAGRGGSAAASSSWSRWGLPSCSPYSWGLPNLGGYWSLGLLCW